MCLPFCLFLVFVVWLNLIFFISAVYDPDPIASLRRRRISTDSQDSGQSHHAAALAAEAARFGGGGGNTSCSSAEESTASHHKDRYGHKIIKRKNGK